MSAKLNTLQLHCSIWNRSVETNDWTRATRGQWGRRPSILGHSDRDLFAIWGKVFLYLIYDKYNFLALKQSNVRTLDLCIIYTFLCRLQQQPKWKCPDFPIQTHFHWLTSPISHPKQNTLLQCIKSQKLSGPHSSLHWTHLLIAPTPLWALVCGPCWLTAGCSV